MINSFVAVLKTCEQQHGAGSKDVIFKTLETLDPDGQELMKCLFNPKMVFGVRKFDRLPEAAYASNDDGDSKIVLDVLRLLAARELTGNSARAAVAEMLAQFSFGSAKYLERILFKDPDAGFSVETYNKAHKSNKAIVFNVQLADKCADADEFEKYITFPCQGDVKYDGERNICFQEGEVTSYVSRSGLPATHMAGLFDEELARIRAHLGYDFVLDGERMAKDYIETINAKKSGADGEAGKKNMRFRAFFLMPTTDWAKQKTTITTRQNRAELQKILAACKCEKIILSEGREVLNYEDMIAYTDVVTTPGFDGQVKGQEGLILKDWDSTYEWDRTMAWCKVKKFFDADATIVSWSFGNKSNANRMGRVNCAGYLEDGTYFEVGVGSGWSVVQREEVMREWDTKWKGAVCTIKYQEVSKGKSKDFASLRFPTFFRGPRDDKEVVLPFTMAEYEAKKPK